MGAVPTLVEPAHGVLLLVGREDFTPPGSFGGATCTATHDCVAVGVAEPASGPTSVDLDPAASTAGLVELGGFRVETEGLLSVRSVYNREYDAVGTTPGSVVVTLWGDDPEAPARLVVRLTA